MNNWNKINVCAFKDVTPDNKIPPLNENIMTCYAGVNPKIEIGYFVILSNRLTYYVRGQRDSRELPQYWMEIPVNLPDEVKIKMVLDEKKNIEGKIEWLEKKRDENTSIIDSLREELKQYE